MEIRDDDMTDDRTRALVLRHLAAMHAGSPPESMHALAPDALRAPSVAVWSAWVDGEIAGVGALKTLDAERGELKSMRVDDRFRGTGVGRAVLRHIVEEARVRGMTSLWLETGTGEEFIPAHRLYESEGFVVCAPFGDYAEDPNSRYMTRAL